MFGEHNTANRGRPFHPLKPWSIFIGIDRLPPIRPVALATRPVVSPLQGLRDSRVKLPRAALAAAGGWHCLQIRPERAAECSHGWSGGRARPVDAEPVDRRFHCSSTPRRGRGSGSLCPSGANWMEHNSFHGFRCAPPVATSLCRCGAESGVDNWATSFASVPTRTNIASAT